MAREKRHLLLLIEESKGSVTFRNNAPAQIKGKGIISLDENTKARNFLYVNGIKHNQLSINQMCGNHYDVSFLSRIVRYKNKKVERW